MLSDPLLGGAPEHDLMTPFNDMNHFDLLRDTHGVVNQASFIDDFFSDEAFPKDILDFGVDFAFASPIMLDPTLPLPGPEPTMVSANLNDMDTGMNRSGVATPGLRGKLNIMASAQAFKESLWLWTPERNDHANLEQRNLSLPSENVSVSNRGMPDRFPLQQRMTGMTRGKILAMVLQTCEPAMYSQVVANFPSAELLTQLVHNFITFHSQSDLPWIHLPTIEVEKERPEFLGGMIGYGSVISPEHEIRKLGFAFQEALRMALPIEVRYLLHTVLM